MAREDVNIKVSADVAEALRMWRAMQAGPEQMANELDALGRRGKQAGSGMEKEFARVVGHWGSIAGAIAAAKKTIDLFIAAQKESLQLTGESTRPVDTLSRAFAVQAGLSNQQAEEARRQILKIAVQRSVTPTQAFSAGKQLVSSGFGAEEVVQGGALNEFLKLLSATNAARPDVNSEELARAATLFIKSTGQPLSTQSIRQNALQIQGLFKGTDIQTAALAQFAPEAGKIAQVSGLGREQLPLLSQFLDVADVAKGGTALRAALSNLATAGKSPRTVRALEQIGLTPEDVSFRGPGSPLKNFLRVQETLTSAFERVDPRTADVVAARLFKEEGLLARNVLFSREGQDRTRERLAIGGDRAAFERDVAITEGGLEARERAAISTQAQAFFDQGFIDPETARRNLISELQTRGFAPINQQVAGTAFDVGLSLTGDVERALNASTQFIEAGGLDAGGIKSEVLRQSRSSTPADLKVTVELTDQDAVAIPHQAEVSQLNTAQ